MKKLLLALLLIIPMLGCTHFNKCYPPEDIAIVTQGGIMIMRKGFLTDEKWKNHRMPAKKYYDSFKEHKGKKGI